ncbi:bifunctional chorismate-binding protein/class IV aminotransferase [Uruburuella suis]|uniref:bifunctional chorismate-binding protein/class IV aminotransferase n=1 Tax=Uruburuella suis TaxID=252130 RepID=UPI00249029AF|nr:bifunctional anthranilate synthase component I family protein/class IV aminotransferase [Uruburuella suis]
MPYFALLDDAVRDCATLYDDYVESRFLQADTLHGLDGLLQQGWQRGLHVVLWADYAFGHPLQHLSPQPDACLALHWFRKCETVAEPEKWLQSRYPDHAPAGISTPTSHTGKADYLHAVGEIQAAIARGDTYQINYTTRLQLQSYGHPAQLYRRLRQPVPYAALAHLPDHKQQPGWTLSFSPELFVNIASDGLITTEPMKGTAPVLGDGGDEARAQALQADPKNRAENIMIVDLLRNDLGKIATTGGVRVPAPFQVRRFGSVWQMTTAIEAQAKPHTSAADIFRAAFPCGSITGAPKRMSMQIIDALETSPRGLYTGSIGYLKPCSSGLGFEGTLNVVIRTLQLKPLSDGLYQGTYGVGSGIVADSEAEAEYIECQWKAHFLNALAPEFGVFETLRAEGGQCALLSLHLERLQEAAAALNLRLPPDAAQQIGRYLQALPDAAPYRVKVLLDSDGLRLSHAACAPLHGAQYALIAPQALPLHDYLRRFKTTRRAAYDAGWQQAEQQGAFDSLFFNTEGCLLEGGRSNVFVRFGSEWHTPPLSLDILNGVMRRAVLADSQHYLNTAHIFERRITQAQLRQADEIVLCNALRGLIRVELKI